ncbi:MAG: carbon starvation CstA 5TM domain-containing protein, partial [Planctomycetota bacterium]
YAAYQGFLVKAPDAGPEWKANPVLAFSVGVAGVCELGLGIPRWLGIVFGLLMVEGFVLDTLDVSIRLNRYLWEEVWSFFFRRVPRLLRSYWFNSGLSVVLMLVLAFTETTERLWPIFGTGNQLLAAMSLTTISVWLYRKKRRVVFVLAPAIVVATTTFAALVYQSWKNWNTGKYLLVGTAVVFFALAVGFGCCVIASVMRKPSPVEA